MIVQGEVILEIKSVASLLPVHEAQLISSLKHNGGGQRAAYQFQSKASKGWN